jgi:hypothetical protein
MSNVNRSGNGRGRFLQLAAGAGLAASAIFSGMSRAPAADTVNLHTSSAGVDTVKRLLVPFQKELGLNVNYNNLPFAQYREAMVGSDQSIGLRCFGQTMFFRMGKERSCKVGERASLSINRSRLHIFDQASGMNVRAQGI